MVAIVLLGIDAQLWLVDKLSIVLQNGQYLALDQTINRVVLCLYTSYFYQDELKI